MKRLYTTLIGLTLTIVLFAQATPPHLKFMGIPIDGTITQFQAKLQAKRCTYNNVSSQISDGARVFDGTFAGEKVTIYVFYNTNTKIVYRVKAAILNLTEDIADTKYNKFKGLLTTKYGFDENNVGEKDGKEAVSFYATTKNIDPLDSSVMYATQGWIDLFYSKSIEYNYLSPYNIHIDYFDKQNYDKHNNTILNDI